MKVIKVSNCEACPFCNHDNEYGDDGCNLDNDVHPNQTQTNHVQMPKFLVHENCPLKKESVTISLQP